MCTSGPLCSAGIQQGMNKCVWRLKAEPCVVFVKGKVFLFQRLGSHKILNPQNAAAWSLKGTKMVGAMED